MRKGAVRAKKNLSRCTCSSVKKKQTALPPSDDVRLEISAWPGRPVVSVRRGGAGQSGDHICSRLRSVASWLLTSRAYRLSADKALLGVSFESKHIPFSEQEFADEVHECKGGRSETAFLAEGFGRCSTIAASLWPMLASERGTSMASGGSVRRQHPVNAKTWGSRSGEQTLTKLEVEAAPFWQQTRCDQSCSQVWPLHVCVHDFSNKSRQQCSIKFEASRA
ncbi:hypothetical protein N657DRAFT_643358 [Parathielavia appendiculata]|uniref:Uncharacterized protein n=1 Tax=Parathielavia appendiculata TaxID=2587402 RepID=A0AAN6Z6N3_9PEZI|nr:hypothetical protein N657DRAFT_643358 [Parathielavia appendiculata]